MYYRNYLHIGEKITNGEGNEIDNPAYDANKVGSKKSEIVLPLKYLIAKCLWM